MNELPLATFQRAIQATHGCRSERIDTVHIVETFKGETVWEGEVLIFELIGHPTATTAYAWSVDQQITAVLHIGPISSPLTAVRASILAGEASNGG